MHIAIRNLTKSYGDYTALDEVSVELVPGQLVALVGANGAGKTTFLRCLAGIAAPTGGEILYDGQRFHRERIDLRRRFALLPDTPFHFEGMTPIEYVAMAVRLYQCESTGLTNRVVEWLRDMHLLAAADCPLRTLSRGERYKAALIALLAVDPELWMLDEPFASGMDPHGLAVLRRETKAATRRGRAILYTTQLLDIAEDFADQVCVLRHGRVLAFGSLAQLRQQLGAGHDASLTSVFAELHDQP